MKNIFTKCIVGAVALLSLGACTSSLDLERKGVLDIESFYKTDEQALEAITACYSSMSNMVPSDLLNYLSDDAWAGNETLDEIHQVGAYSFGTDNSTILSAFQGLYSLIYKANVAISRIEEDTPVKKQCVAEAKVFRAACYFQIANLWGDAPLIIEEDTDGDYAVAKSPEAEIWAQVEKDLKEAIESGSLVQKAGPSDGKTSIRLTKQSAEALLGKTYIFEQKWDEAIKALDSVISSGKYALADCTVGELFQAPQNLNSEAMIFINQTCDSNIHAFDIAAIASNPRNELFDGLTLSWNMGTGKLFWIGWGYTSVQKSLLDAFKQNGEYDGERRQSTFLTADEVCREGACTMAKGTAAWPGIEGVWDWKHHLDISSNVPSTFAGFYNNKIIMRYAEVLLLMAEAQIMKNGDGAGDKYINEVRTRSHLPEKSGMTLEDLKLEKRCELGLEGLRYLDLKRWGDRQKYLGAQGTKFPMFQTDENGVSSITYVALENAGWKAGRNEFLPIPAKELEVNPLMEQNPAYSK